MRRASRWTIGSAMHDGMPIINMVSKMSVVSKNTAAMSENDTRMDASV